MEHFLLKILLTVLPLVTLKGKASLQIYSLLIVLVFQLGKLKHLMNLYFIVNSVFLLQELKWHTAAELF